MLLSHRGRRVEATKDSVFCDYLRVSQNHESGHKPTEGGILTKIDPQGAIEYESRGWLQGQLSNGAAVSYRSDGNRVEVDGNPSNDGPGNAFGISVDQAKLLINDFLGEVGLPRFDQGHWVELESGAMIYTGGRFSRLDITTNLATGGPEDRNEYMRHLQNSTVGKLERTIHGENVYHGYGSQTRMLRVYDKGREIREKAGSKITAQEKQLCEYLDEQGAIRIEWTWRKHLRTLGLCGWHEADHETTTSSFNQECNFMTKKLIAADFDEIPAAALGALLMYFSGIDPRKKYHRNTFNKHRKVLKEFGYDIGGPVPAEIKPREKTIILRMLEIPDFYKYPSGKSPTLRVIK